MTIDFGLQVPYRLSKDNYGNWLADMDTCVDLLKDDFRSLWMADHFFWNNEAGLEAWTVLSFLAARYSNWEVGSHVLSQSFRNPALTALMASTLQMITGGRFIMGIGAGWKEDEYLAYDYEFPRAGIRIEQLEDTLSIFKKLWTEAGQVSYEGKHYRVVDARCEPKPDPMIPIMVGGGGNKTRRLAAQHADIWNWGMDIKTYTELVDGLKQHCDDLGRDFSTLRLAWSGGMTIVKTEEDAKHIAEEKGHSEPFVGTADQIAEKMAAFIELGVDYFILNISGLPDPDIAGLVTEELMPKIKTL